jgi:hypothetical protein
VAGLNIIMEKIFNMLWFGMDKTEKAIAERGRYSIGKIERKLSKLFMMMGDGWLSREMGG